MARKTAKRSRGKTKPKSEPRPLAEPDSSWARKEFLELRRLAVEKGDYATALRAVAKISEIATGDPAAPTENAVEAEARAHLAPLFEDGESLPLVELARLAAQRIVSGK